jgi:hypothetical protein
LARSFSIALRLTLVAALVFATLYLFARDELDDLVDPLRTTIYNEYFRLWVVDGGEEGEDEMVKNRNN